MGVDRISFINFILPSISWRTFCNKENRRNGIITNKYLICILLWTYWNCSCDKTSLYDPLGDTEDGGRFLKSFGVSCCRSSGSELAQVNGRLFSRPVTSNRIQSLNVLLLGILVYCSPLLELGKELTSQTQPSFHEHHRNEGLGVVGISILFLPFQQSSLNKLDSEEFATAKLSARWFESPLSFMDSYTDSRILEQIHGLWIIMNHGL